MSARGRNLGVRKRRPATRMGMRSGTKERDGALYARDVCGVIHVLTHSSLECFNLGIFRKIVSAIGFVSVMVS